MKKLYWKIKHWFTGCPSHSVVEQTKAWNPAFPDYITPRCICSKCGTHLTRGKIYPDEPWPTRPMPDHLKCAPSCNPEKCEDCELLMTKTEIKDLADKLRNEE